MLTARYFNAAGEPAETFELPQDPFDGVVHDAALHQVIKAQLANRRQGTASTKTRGEVSGGSRKIWRQKGTGRARQGSIRAPHWRGGGIVFGPRPRTYHQDVPKKVKALARRSAFNRRALAEQVAVIEAFQLEAPRTRLVVQLLDRMGLAERKLLLLTDGINEMLVRSARNLPNVRVLPYREVSAYELMRSNQLIIEAAALRAQNAEAEAEVVHA
jgi:large subunit ribosomal protein L4